MTRPPLVAVAHGSRDARAQQAVEALVTQVRSLLPDVDVRTAYVELASPSLADVLGELSAARRRAVVVPLLLAAGYHVRVDVAGEAGRAHALAPALGPDEALTEVLVDRLAAVRGLPADAVVLAAAGSSDPRAVADVRRQALLLARRLRTPVEAAFLSAAAPTVADAVSTRQQGGERVAVATYLLAPGLFADRLASLHGVVVAAPLAPHPRLAALVAARYLSSEDTCTSTHPSPVPASASASSSG